MQYSFVLLALDQAEKLILRERIHIKRTCYGCKALQDGISNFKCILNYKIDIQTDWTKPIPVTKVRPLEECEKPKTYSELVYLKPIRDRIVK